MARLRSRLGSMDSNRQRVNPFVAMVTTSRRHDDELDIKL
jgi:hypothetical protein